MKRGMITTLLVSGLMLAVGCGSMHYVIQTKDGKEFISRGEPEFNKKTQAYEFTDVNGRKWILNRENIQSIELGNKGSYKGALPAGRITISVKNSVPMPPACMQSMASLTFFTTAQEQHSIMYGDTQPIPLEADPWGNYGIGFQVNGWYWMCGGGSNCPNLNNCQNPDNAGNVGFHVTSVSPCGVQLVKNFGYTCDDANVPNASEGVSVQVIDPNSCTVEVKLSGTPIPAPSDNCCSCRTCTGGQIPPGQTPHCKN